MKILKTLIFAAAVLLFAQNCSTNNPGPELQRQWMMTSFQNYPREQLVANRAQLDLAVTKSPEKQYRAKMGCNQIFFKADFSRNGTVKFYDAGSTMMYCEGKMKLEDDFLKTLKQMNRYVVDGHHLTLASGDGKTMKFVAADWD